MLGRDEKLFLLQRACERGHLDFHEMVKAARKGLAQFHDTDNGLAITSNVQSGKWKICQILAVGANSAGLEELHNEIKKYAAETGCHVVRAEGRHGFERAKRGYDPLVAAGFKAVGIVYEMTISEPPR